MLAYVFWHQPRAGAELRDYEERLSGFHRALAASPPEGFLRSSAHRLDACPWLPSSPPAYEDWYELTGSAALDLLDHAAVGHRLRAVHDEVAAQAGAGAGGLYKCRRDAPEPAGDSVALWLSKPAGTPYAAFFAGLDARFPPPARVWQRQMVLGPGLEFCVVAPAGVAPAADLLVIHRTRIV